MLRFDGLASCTMVFADLVFEFLRHIWLVGIDDICVHVHDLCVCVSIICAYGRNPSAPIADHFQGAGNLA